MNSEQVHLKISCDRMSMTSKFCYQHIAKMSQSYIPDHTNSLTFPSEPFSEPLQNSLTLPGFQKF